MSGTLLLFTSKAGPGGTVSNPTIGSPVIGAKGLRLLATDAAGNLIETFPPTVIVNMTLSNILTSAAPIGDTSYFTVPVGKRAVMGRISIYNPTGASISFTLLTTIGGVTFKSSALTPVGAGGTAALSHSLVYEAGEILSFSTTAAGLNFLTPVVLFDISSGFKSPRLTSLIVGNNVLYTCPPGKIVTAASPSTFNQTGSQNIFINNGTAGSLTYNVYFVPNGEVLGAQHQTGAVVVAAGAVGQHDITPGMLAGDSIVIAATSAAADQLIRTTINEMPA